MNLKDSRVQKALLGGILVAGIAYAFHQYIYTPKQVQIADATAEAERLERYNDTVKRAVKANRLAALEEQSVTYARRLDAVEELIPTTEQVPQLLERIATAALESDVDLLSFTPLPAEPGTFYTEQFYEVEVRGGYHETGVFLARIANLPRIVKPTITELLGERVEAPAQGGPPPAGPPPAPPETVVRATVQLSAYVLPGGEAQVVEGDTARARAAAAGVAPVPPPAEVPPAAPPAPTAAPAAASPPPEAPPLEQRLAPGVAPGIAAQRARDAAAAAAGPSATGAATAPSAAAAVDTAGPGPSAAEGQVPPPATGAAIPRVAPPLTQPAPPPATPGDLTPPGGRATREDDPARPGALPPLGERDQGSP